MQLLNTLASSVIFKHFWELIPACGGVFEVLQACHKNRNTPNALQRGILRAEWLQT
jgi:hypothetical protein